MKYFASLLVLPIAAFCGAAGNPSSPFLIKEGFATSQGSPASLRIGYEGDFVENGRMNQTAEGTGRVDSFQQVMNMATITVNVVDRLDFYGVVGASQFSANWRFTNAAQVLHRIQIETLSQFLWGAGFRAVLAQWGRLTLGAGGRYQTAKSDPLWMTSDAANISVQGATTRWRSWQADLDFSYQIDFLIPYVGVQYLNSRCRMGNFSTPIASSGGGTTHFHNQEPVGVVLGCSLTNGKYFFLNAEVRLIAEEAATISGDLRF